MYKTTPRNTLGNKSIRNVKNFFRINPPLFGSMNLDKMKAVIENLDNLIFKILKIVDGFKNDNLHLTRQ